MIQSCSTLKTLNQSSILISSATTSTSEVIFILRMTLSILIRLFLIVSIRIQNLIITLKRQKVQHFYYKMTTLQSFQLILFLCKGPAILNLGTRAERIWVGYEIFLRFDGARQIFAMISWGAK